MSTPILKPPQVPVFNQKTAQTAVMAGRAYIKAKLDAGDDWRWRTAIPGIDIVVTALKFLLAAQAMTIAASAFGLCHILASTLPSLFTLKAFAITAVAYGALFLAKAYLSNALLVATIPLLNDRKEGMCFFPADIEAVQVYRDRLVRHIVEEFKVHLPENWTESTANRTEILGDGKNQEMFIDQVKVICDTYNLLKSLEEGEGLLQKVESPKGEEKLLPKEAYELYWGARNSIDTMRCKPEDLQTPVTYVEIFETNKAHRKRSTWA